MNAPEMIISVTKMLNVSTMWDPTIVPANWGLKATGRTASVSNWFLRKQGNAQLLNFHDFFQLPYIS